MSCLLICFALVSVVMCSPVWIMGGVWDSARQPSQLTRWNMAPTCTDADVGNIRVWKCSSKQTPLDMKHQTQVWCWIKCLDLHTSAGTGTWLLTHLAASTDWVTTTTPQPDVGRVQDMLGKPCDWTTVLPFSYGVRISRLNGLVMHDMDCIPPRAFSGSILVPSPILATLPAYLLLPDTSFHLWTRGSSSVPECDTAPYDECGGAGNASSCQADMLLWVCHSGSETLCGDGQVQEQAGEQCDDGNQDGGDGCSESCQIETCPSGFTGASCSQCQSGRYGAQCLPCPSFCTQPFGLCDEGVRGSGACICLQGYQGSECRTCQTGYHTQLPHFCIPCGSGMCSPHGSCVQTTADGLITTCLCQAGWSGTQCDNSHGVGLVTCDQQACGPWSKCQDPTGGTFWTSPNMPSPSLRCTCVHNRMGNKCATCRTGHIGPDCEPCSFCHPDGCAVVPDGVLVTGRRVWQTASGQGSYICTAEQVVQVTPPLPTATSDLVPTPIFATPQQRGLLILEPNQDADLSHACVVVSATGSSVSSTLCHSPVVQAALSSTPTFFNQRVETLALLGSEMVQFLVSPDFFAALPSPGQIGWQGAATDLLALSTDLPQSWEPQCLELEKCSGFCISRGWLTDALCPLSCFCFVPSLLPLPLFDVQKEARGMRWNETMTDVPQLVVARREWQVVADLLSLHVPSSNVTVTKKSLTAMSFAERQELQDEFPDILWQ